MTEYIQWIEQHFELLFAFSLLSGVLSAAFLAWRRHRAGPTHPPFTQADVRFQEKYVSGRSDKNLLSRIGGATNALVVTVLKDALLVEPITIIKWIMPAGFNDLEHYVERSNILRIEPASAFGQRTVRIEIRGRDGMARTLELALRKHEEFLAALRPVGDKGRMGN